MRRAAGYTLAVLTLINLFNYLDRWVIAALVESLRKSELHLTDTELGFIASGFIIIYTLASPVFGTLGDRRARPPLIDADRRARDEQRREAAREPAQRRGDAPDHHAERDQRRAGAAVAERAEHRRRQRIDDDEAAGDEAELRVGEVQLRFAQRLHQRRDDPAVEVIEEIDEGQDGERVTGRAAHSRAV